MLYRPDAASLHGKPPKAASDHHVLPSPSELLCALAGHSTRGRICDCASRLTQLHRHRSEYPGRSAALDSHRTALVDEINTWADRHFPDLGCTTRLHEATLGDFVDRIAEVAARAFHLLMTDDPAGLHMHAAWTELAELEVTYGELTRAVRDGRRPQKA